MNFEMVTAEFFNILIALALVIALQIRYQLRMVIVVVLLLHLYLVFLTNYVLFNPSYMYDQFKYIRVAQGIRSGDISLIQAIQQENVGFAGSLFAIFPIPAINSIYSIAIANFILYLIIFIFLYDRKVLRGNTLWFYLIYPSLLLNSSIAQRDIMILLCMVVGFYYCIQKKYIFVIISQIPLWFLKFQNVEILILSIVIIWIIRSFVYWKKKTNLQKILVVLFLIGIAIVIPSIYRKSMDTINLYRWYMWVEDTKILTPIKSEKQITGFFDLLKTIAGSTFYFLIKPLPWQADNLFQFVQSIENLVVTGIIVLMVGKSFLKRMMTSEMNLLLIYLVVSLAVYGLVVWNFGTAARYRFPFLTVFIVMYGWLYRVKVHSTSMDDNKEAVAENRLVYNRA